MFTKTEIPKKFLLVTKHMNFQNIFIFTQNRNLLKIVLCVYPKKPYRQLLAKQNQSLFIGEAVLFSILNQPWFFTFWEIFISFL